MKKKLLPFKILFFTSLGLTAIALIVFMIMYSMDIEVEYTYRYTGGEIIAKSWYDTFRVGTYILAGLILLLMLATIYFVFDAYKKKQEKLWLNLIVSIVSIPIMMGIVIGGGLVVTGVAVKYETTCYMITPKKYPVVISEKYREGECKCEVFQIMGNGDAYRLGGFSTENGYRDRDSYRFVETENGVTIYFAYTADTRGYIEGVWVEK